MVAAWAQFDIKFFWGAPAIHVYVIVTGQSLSACKLRKVVSSLVYMLIIPAESQNVPVAVTAPQVDSEQRQGDACSYMSCNRW